MLDYIKNNIICPLIGFNRVPQNKFPYCFKLEGQPREESVLFESEKTILDGDSICHTLNAKAWFGVNATNYAVGGSTTDDVLGRIDKVLAAKPKRIISDICGNDVLRFHPTDHILNNLKAIFEKYLSVTPYVYQNSIPYLNVSVPGSLADLKKLLILIFSGIIPNYDSSLTLSSLVAMQLYKNKSYNFLVIDMNEKIKNLCYQMGVIYVDIFTPLSKNYPKYNYDGIHPNPYGMKAWTDTVKGAILAKEGIKLV